MRAGRMNAMCSHPSTCVIGWPNSAAEGHYRRQTDGRLVLLPVPPWAKLNHWRYVSATVNRTGYLLDFASALYLGLSHPSRSIPAWEQLTTGKPAALATPPGASEVSEQLALLQGCQSATLATSTLHLFLDFFGTFAAGPVTVYADAETYPI